MLEILFIWFVFTIVGIFWGEHFCKGIGKKWVPEFEANIWIHFWVGISILSFFLGLLSFFSKLSPIFKLGIWLGLIIPVISSFSWLKSQFQIIKSGLFQLGIPGLLLVLSGIIIALLKSSGIAEIFDEGAYHLPLIRMWETQGLVPGMANLNGHYGLNSSWHILTALSNFDFFPGWKLAIGLNGLLAVVLSFYAGFSLNKILKKNALVSDWIILILPFFVFRNLLSSPSTDIPAIICSWFIFTLWLQNIEKEESPWKIWPILGILPFWVVMIKASSAALILIPIGLLALSYKEKKQDRFWLITISGISLLIPWVVQNWFLTGYGVFPIRSTAFGNPEWQVPIASINNKFYLHQFGAFAPPEHYTWDWFKFWFKAHNKDTQIILLLVLSGLISVTIALLRREEERVWAKVYLLGTVLACLLTWFVTITEPRYGFGVLVFSALFPIGFVGHLLSKKYPGIRLVALSIILLQFYNSWKSIKESNFSFHQILAPAERPKVEFQTIQCGNFSAYSPTKYVSKVPENKPVFCWDCPFPCIPKEGQSDSLQIFEIQVLGKTGFSFHNPK
jgi:uncharacterized membrane protein YecN with MAPEG domain